MVLYNVQLYRETHGSTVLKVGLTNRALTTMEPVYGQRRPAYGRPCHLENLPFGNEMQSVTSGY